MSTFEAFLMFILISLASYLPPLVNNEILESCNSKKEAVINIGFFKKKYVKIKCYQGENLKEENKQGEG